VWAHYGQAEHLILGGACEHSDDYHLWPSYGLAELLTEDGQEITDPGQPGELVGTTLTNPAMPLIRYRTGDFAEWSPGECACGRKWLRIRNVIGKYGMEALRDTEGGVYNLSLIMRVIVFLEDIYPFEHLYRYQFIQKIPGEVDLRIIPRSSFTARMAELIREGLQYTQQQHQVQIQEAEDIFEKSGKIGLFPQQLEPK
jgi:phenylacetate-CoA ligase